MEPFERVGRRLVLTPAGRELFGRFERVVALARELFPEAPGSESGELCGRVRYGTLPAVSAHLVAQPLARLLANKPGLGITVTLGLADVLAAQLRSGALDVVLFVGARHTEGLALELLGEDRLVAAMAPRLAPRTRGVIRATELRSRRYLAWGGLGDETFDAAHAYATSGRFVGETTPFVPNIETLRELATSGAGWTLLPSYTVARDVRERRLVALRPVGLAHRIPFFLGSRQAQPPSPALGAVSTMLREATASFARRRA